jgi:hypothetical protein
MDNDELMKELEELTKDLEKELSQNDINKQPSNSSNINRSQSNGNNNPDKTQLSGEQNKSQSSSTQPLNQNFPFNFHNGNENDYMKALESLLSTEFCSNNNDPQIVEAMKVLSK